MGNATISKPRTCRRGRIASCWGERSMQIQDSRASAGCGRSKVPLLRRTFVRRRWRDKYRWRSRAAGRPMPRSRRGRRDGAGLDFAQDFAQDGGEFFAADLALAEMHAHVEGIVLGAIVEEEGLGPWSGLGFFLTRAASFIAGETALGDALHHFLHLLFSGLASDLQK